MIKRDTDIQPVAPSEFSISRTISNVDPNTDFSFVNVVTVAFYCSRSMIIFVFISNPYRHVDSQRTAALGAIKGDEPSLTAAATASQVNVALENNTESGVVLLLGKNAILKNN